MTYLIMSIGHHPVEHFTELAEAREYVQGTTHYIKYVPAPGEPLVKPDDTEESCQRLS